MIAVNSLSWALRAACRGIDLEDFFTESRTGVRRAKSICAGCPVRRRCLAEALRAEDASRYGVYGGLTAAERTKLVKRKAASKAPTTAPKTPRQPAKCGTRPGYQKHLREKTKVCAPCRQANTDADNRLRRTGTSKAAR